MSLQWFQSQNKFYASEPGKPHTTLPPGLYIPEAQMDGSYALEAQTLETDELIMVEGAEVYQIIANIQAFWERKSIFDALGLVHKRGILLYGAPGTGKSATIELLAKQVIQGDGVVLDCDVPGDALEGIKLVRSVEPDCRIMVILEDIDNYMPASGRGNGADSQLSGLLDGANQVGNVVYAATTNYIDKVPARLKNRPSRFDEVVEVGMPSERMRLAFLTAKIPPTERADLARWASDTTGFSIAHLRELIVGTVALGRPYEEVLARLKLMIDSKENIESAPAVNALAKSHQLIADIWNAAGATGEAKRG